MKKTVNLLFYAVSIFFFGCEKESNAPQTAFKVSGYVNYQDDILDEVIVSIDEKLNLTTRTDSNGYFEIDGVEQGDHQLHITKEINYTNEATNEDVSATSEKTVDIAINQDTEIDNLRLPKAIILYDAQSVLQSSANILWSSTDDNEFREYKVYRHNSSGLDESTGTLIHISTALNDTTFIDEGLNPFEQYYYRVYVLDDFGKIGGSNIMDLTTENIQIIGNGGFEDTSNDLPLSWSLTPNDFGNQNNYINISTVNPYEETNCLEFHHSEETGCWEQWITQSIDKNSLVASGSYRLSFANKADFTGTKNMYLILRNSTIDLWLSVPIQFEEEWNETTYEFGLPNDIGNTDITADFHFCIEGISTWWLDNIKIERIQ